MLEGANGFPFGSPPLSTPVAHGYAGQAGHTGLLASTPANVGKTVSRNTCVQFALLFVCVRDR